MKVNDRLNVNDMLNECAKNLSDEKLLAKLSAGDAVVQEFKYHPACLVGLYNEPFSIPSSMIRALKVQPTKTCISLPFQNLSPTSWT